MKRLFCIKSRSSGKVVSDQKGPRYFESKMDAKLAREALLAPLPVEEPPQYYVAPGPDHKRSHA